MLGKGVQSSPSRSLYSDRGVRCWVSPTQKRCERSRKPARKAPDLVWWVTEGGGTRRRPKHKQKSIRWKKKGRSHSGGQKKTREAQRQERADGNENRPVWCRRPERRNRREAGEPGASSAAEQQTASRRHCTHAYLLGRYVIASKAGGGTQIFGQRVEGLGLLVEEPYLERKRMPVTFASSAQEQWGWCGSIISTWRNSKQTPKTLLNITS